MRLNQVGQSSVKVGSCMERGMWLNVADLVGKFLYSDSRSPRTVRIMTTY